MKLDSAGYDAEGRWHPQHLNKWRCGVGNTTVDNASNYMGAHFDNMYVAPCTTYRDADVLQRCNWEVQMAVLDELTGNIYDDEGVCGTNNWAVGWTEVYLIHPRNEPALRAADELASALEDYPLLDEDKYCEMEYEEANEFWASLNVRERAHYAERYAYDWTPMQLRHDYLGALSDSGELSSALTRN
jgi:hypothetical protein